MTGRDEKMALRITETLPLVTALLLIAAISQGQTEDVILLSGSDFTLSPNYRGDFKEITWLLNNNRLVELELNKKKEPVWYKSFPQLKAGASLNNQTGALTIPRLTIRDSGKYRAEVKLHDLTYNYTDITLTVLDPVVTPIITNHTVGDWIHLNCESASPRVSYEWQDDEGNIVSTDKTYIIPKHTEAVLTLTCIASNTVSERRASVTIIPPDRLSGGIIAGILVGIIVPIICIFECIRRKYPNHPRVKAINKRCPPFPYIPCCITALCVGQPSLFLSRRDLEIHKCGNNPCCIREFLEDKFHMVEDQRKRCSRCTHDPCCIRDLLNAGNNDARRNMAEDLETYSSRCTHNPCCIRDLLNAGNNDARRNMAEDNLKPENEGNGTLEQQEILLKNMGKVKGNKTGSREEV